jgi:hypothetical protein
VLATIGLVANDSSVAVPLTMLIVIGPAGILQAVAPAARDRGPAAGPPSGPPPPVTEGPETAARRPVGQAS